jgi:hypothetical protein
MRTLRLQTLPSHGLRVIDLRGNRQRLVDAETAMVDERLGPRFMDLRLLSLVSEPGEVVEVLTSISLTSTS